MPGASSKGAPLQCTAGGDTYAPAYREGPFDAILECRMWDARRDLWPTRDWVC